MNRIALVTGANRGIGLEICKQLVALGHHVIVTARDAAKGRDAAMLVRDSAKGARVAFHALDVNSEESVALLKDSITREHGEIDILINNAGVLIDRGESLLNVPMHKVEATLNANVLGTWRMCQAFVPGMLQVGYGRVVNVSSTMGQLDGMGTGTAAYRVSKVAVNGITAVLAAEITAAGAHDVKVNCCHPGWVRTDMGGPGASKAIPDGADTPVWLATLPADGPHGGFFDERKRVNW